MRLSGKSVILLGLGFLPSLFAQEKAPQNPKPFHESYAVTGEFFAANPGRRIPLPPAAIEVEQGASAKEFIFTVPMIGKVIGQSRDKTSNLVVSASDSLSASIVPKSVEGLIWFYSAAIGADSTNPKERVRKPIFIEVDFVMNDPKDHVEKASSIQLVGQQMFEGESPFDFYPAPTINRGSGTKGVAITPDG